MKITETSPVTNMVPIAPPDSSASAAPKDRVTVSASRQAQASVTAVQASVDRARPARLKDLEAQVRAGDYHPDPTQVATQIMNDAEIDARMQALLQH